MDKVISDFNNEIYDIKRTFVDDHGDITFVVPRTKLPGFGCVTKTSDIFCILMTLEEGMRKYYKNKNEAIKNHNNKVQY